MKTRAVLFLVAVILVVGTATAGVLHVEQDGSGDYLLIQDAVDAAADGDTILIGPGRYDDLQPRGDNNVVCVARWDDNRSLSFIGEDAATVIIGPTVYEPVGTGPQGIHQHEPADIRVEGMTFENLRFGVVAGGGSSLVRGIHCITGEHGVFIHDPDICIVRDSSFRDLEDYSVATFNSGYAEVSNCELDHAKIYFGSAQYGVVRDCTVTSGSLAMFFLSKGLVVGCTAQCSGFGPCIGVSDSDTVRIYDSVIHGGGANLSVSGGATETNVFAERNVFTGPTDWGMSFYLTDFATVIAQNNHIDRGGDPAQTLVETNWYPAGNTATVDFGSNYWYEDGTPEILDSLIHDGHDDPELQVLVNYGPILTEPVPAKTSSFGGVKALFR